MPEHSLPAPLTSFGKDFSLGTEDVARPKLFDRLAYRLPGDVDPQDLKDLAQVFGAAAMLLIGSQSKDLAHTFHDKLVSQRTACYVDKGKTSFDEKCTDGALATGESIAGWLMVIGYSGGTALTGSLVASQYRRSRRQL